MAPQKGRQDEVLGEASSDNFQRYSFEQDGKRKHEHGPRDHRMCEVIL